MALLRHNKTFQEYPLDTQLDLIKCMVYQRYEARRIVLKQGHRPFAFYIILSGTCLVNVQEVDSRTGRSMVRTVREITGGDQFGEIAFMNNCTRTASIVCKDDVELLVIHAEDFNRIIRVPLERKREDHIDFCKRLDMFRNWPVEKLRENRQGFIYQYFKQDSVIVEDTRTANYIIIVKAGRCKVVAKIHELKARRRPSSGGRAESNFPLIEMQKRREAKMPRCLSVITPRDLSQFITTSYRRRPTSRLAVTPTHLSHDHREETRHVNRATVPKSTLEIMMGKKSSILKKSVSEKSPELEDSGPSVEKKVKFPSDGIKRTWKRLQVAAKNLQDKEDGSKQKQLLVHPNRVRTVFAQIATMTPGAVFGLESVKSTSNLSLISEGAECILVSKKLFLNEASSKVMQSLSIMENDFPSPEAALQEIRRARNWEKYKTRVVRDVVSRATKNF
uniref:Cyclic nucleotide-binding domain-containing protein 2-like n=1 Tax=Saccoglossus kowalevskii TaxID=10224 RepID=A0ABM0MI60_SACKO|nr:PREDICTED: cyclic nucleotide-binding domain-containing protein 2-like [Saccoglossus kowalevskii]